MIQVMKDAIANAAQAIELEFSNGQNDWLACLNSRLQVLLSAIDLPTTMAQLGADSYRRASDRLAALITRAKNLHQQYNGRKNSPPDDIKHELLRELDILST